MHELAEAFVPRPPPRRRTPSGNGHGLDSFTLYYSPSNPFCTRSRSPSPQIALPRTARRLDFDDRPPPYQVTEGEEKDRRGLGLIMEMAVMVIFWATLVVFVSSLGGFNRRTMDGEGGGWEAWHVGGVHRDLEGIWDAARPPA